MAKAAKEADASFEDDGASFENTNEGLTVDLSNVEAQKFDVLPKGTYNTIVEDVEFQISKSSNQPMWNFKFAVTDEEYQNRKLFMYMSFSPKALSGTKANLAALAPELLDGPFDPKSEEILASLRGKAVKVKIKVESYEGEEKNTVQKLLAAANADGFA